MTSPSALHTRIHALCVGNFVLLTSLLVCLGGCGNGNLPTYPVSGQLVYEDGSVPQFGMVEFYNAEHQVNARGKIAKDGSFSLTTYAENDGAILGTHKVAIIQQTSNHLVASQGVKINHDHGSVVHSRYFDYRTSGLTCDVSKGDNPIQFTLEKGPEEETTGHH